MVGRDPSHKLEFQRRVDRALGLLVSGLQTSVVAAALVADYEVSERQAYYYIARARKAILACMDADRPYNIAVAKQRYESLYNRALSPEDPAVADYKSALEAQKALVALLGLNAPVRNEVDHRGSVSLDGSAFTVVVLDRSLEALPLPETPGDGEHRPG